MTILSALCLGCKLLGKFFKVEDIPENVVHDHERNGLPRLSSMSDAEITERSGKVHFKFQQEYSTFLVTMACYIHLFSHMLDAGIKLSTIILYTTAIFIKCVNHCSLLWIQFNNVMTTSTNYV